MDTLEIKKTMATKEQLINDFSELLAKYGAWITYVGVGLIGKLGWDIVNRKHISGWYLFGTGCISIFVGFIASRWFMSHMPEAGAYCVPVLTLASRDVLVFIKVIQWDKVLSFLTKLPIKGNDNDNH